MTISAPTSEPPEAPEALAAAPMELTEESGSLAARFLRDRALLALLALTLVFDLFLFGFLALRFESMNDLLPLHFDVTGLPDRIDAKNGIFALPLIGLIVLFVNTLLGILVHRQQRAASLLLAVGGLTVQVLLLIAAINIVSRGS